MSTNSVTDFDVNSDGTILNNSATGGTALGTAVTANSNITAGSEASLILLQVIPLGLAIINPASPPNTSIVPPKSLPLVPVTCNRIRDASLPAVILELAVTAVPRAVPPVALLFKIVPSELTSKSVTELVDNPATGAAILVVTTAAKIVVIDKQKNKEVISIILFIKTEF